MSSSVQSTPHSPYGQGPPTGRHSVRRAESLNSARDRHGHWHTGGHSIMASAPSSGDHPYEQQQKRRPMDSQEIAGVYKHAQTHLVNALHGYNKAIQYARKIALDVLTAVSYKDTRIGSNQGPRMMRKVTSTNVALRQDFAELKRAAEVIAIQFVMNERRVDVREGWCLYKGTNDPTDLARQRLHDLAGEMFGEHRGMRNDYPGKVISLIDRFVREQVEARQLVMDSHATQYSAGRGAGQMQSQLSLDLQDPDIRTYHKEYTKDDSAGNAIRRGVRKLADKTKGFIEKSKSELGKKMEVAIDKLGKGLQRGSRKLLVQAGARSLMDSKLRSKFILSVLDDTAPNVKLQQAYHDVRIAPLTNALAQASTAMMWFVDRHPGQQDVEIWKKEADRFIRFITGEAKPSVPRYSAASALELTRYVAFRVAQANMKLFHMDFTPMDGDGHAMILRKSPEDVSKAYFDSFDKLMSVWSVWATKPVDSGKGFAGAGSVAGRGDRPRSQTSSQPKPPGQPSGQARKAQTVSPQAPIDKVSEYIRKKVHEVVNQLQQHRTHGSLDTNNGAESIAKRVLDIVKHERQDLTKQQRTRIFGQAQRYASSLLSSQLGVRS